jgi:hypothetical protein
MTWRREQLRRLLATSSLVSLALGTATHASAACSTTHNNAGNVSCISISNATFSGNVNNSGTVSPGGIYVVNSTITSVANNYSTVTGAIEDSGSITGGVSIDSRSKLNNSGGSAVSIRYTNFGGGISNAGTITATNGNGIVVGAGGTTFSGGISNTGTMVVESGAGVVVLVSTFSGGISNTGTIISKSDSGIGIRDVIFAGSEIGITVSGSSTFSGGIRNSGTITSKSGGVSVVFVSTFVGGIVNSGTITSKSANNGISVWFGSTFAGGIVNSGSISGNQAGIWLIDVGTFSGGINNSGTISGGEQGIIVSGNKLSGGISNSGAIVALGISGTFGNGINVSISTFSGGIVNSGAISASGTHGAGIYVDGVANFSGGIVNSGTVISAQNAGIAVEAVSSFTGGISNSGMISAGLSSLGSGILVENVAEFGSSSAGGGITNNGAISANNNGIYLKYDSIFAGGIVNGASGTIAAGYTGISVNGVSTFAGGVTNSGTISAAVGSISVGSRAAGISVSSGSTFSGGIFNSGAITGGDTGIRVVAISNFFGGITNSSTITSKNFAGIYVLSVSTFAGPIVNSGTISAGGAAIDVGGAVSHSGSTYSGDSNFSGGITNSGIISGKTGILVYGVSTFSGAIANSGNITGTGGAAIDVSGANNAITIDQMGGTITGAIKLSAFADVLNVTGGTINGNIVGRGSSDTINFALGTGTFTYASAYGFSGVNQVNINSGTVILNGVNNATNVAVNGGTLAGTGTIDPTAVTINSGGTLAPGTPGGFGTLTIVGNLVFNAGSFYAVQIAPGAGNNSKTAVIGAAYLGGNGTVVVTPQLGKYDTSYQILTATGGIIGSFAGVSINGSFIGNMTIGDLDLVVNGASVLAMPSGANQNQQNVVRGINNGIVNNPVNTPLPPQFLNVGNLSGPVLLNALSQLSGEAATGAEQSAFQLTNEFLNLMLDPFVNGRGYAPGATSGGNALGFAPDEQTSLPPDVALAYASILGKAPAPSHPSPASGGGSGWGFDQRWSAWGAAFGGSNTTSGDPTVGSHDITTGTYGFAAGMDYHVSPSTIVGFALAGAGTNWGLSNGLGGGYSDALQVGTYGITWFGPAYLAGALSFTNHWFTTNRSALGDQLTANFVGQSYGARFEGGYRFTPSLPSPASGGGLGWGLGVTPYGALQAQDFQTPSYSENDVTGGGFGLSYNAMNATDVRTELGARFDDPTLLYGKPLILFGRLAWAHDFVSNPALSAAFEALPGSTFIVNGAPIPQNSALTTAGAQFFLASYWSLIAKFDGAFAAGSQTYAGSGTLRYSW